MEEALWAAIRRLEPLQPRFVSVTYGAGGSTRERTHTTVARLVRETALVPAAHLTCVEATKAEVDEVARAYKAAGVSHIVALRGDPPAGVGTHVQPASRRLRQCRRSGRRASSASATSRSRSPAIPRSTPTAPTLAADLDNLKAKVDAGADRAITQFFFDNAHYLRFLEAARARGIWAPIVPGIVPIHNFKQVAGFAGRCGATMPAWLARRFDGLDDDPQTTHLVAAAVAAEQVMDLVDQGIRQFHFYTLNRADLVYAICHLLGLQAASRPPRQGGGQRMTREQRIAALKAAAQERILIIDGAMGTMIQRHKLDEAGYRGTRFADFAKPVKGNNDLLVLTQPQIIAEIHEGYLAAGADIISTNTFNAQRISLADYGMEDLAYEINLAAAKLARAAADALTRQDARQAALRRRRPRARPTARPPSRPTSTIRASATSRSTSWSRPTPSRRAA